MTLAVLPLPLGELEETSRMFAVLEEMARSHVRFAYGFTDWRAMHPAPEPDVIDLEPRIEVFHGQPRTVWST